MKINQLTSKMGTNVSRFIGKTGFTVKKNSPEILLGVGIVGFVGTVVMASKATLKAGDVIEKHKKKMAEINEAVAMEKEEELVEGYSTQIAPQEKVYTCIKTGGEFIKLYWPAVTMGSISIACILKSHSIMQARYLGAVAAFNAVSEAFKTYRERVIEEEGEIADRHYRYGTEREKLMEEITDENGKKKKQKTEVETLDSSKLPKYDFCRVFDESNRNWDPNPTMSMMFLKGQQAVMNNILHTRGHLFLNEVYEALGFEQCPEGQVVGWIDDDPDETTYVNFGLYDYENGDVARFVNGKASSILLNFNHDGVIFEKI